MSEVFRDLEAIQVMRRYYDWKVELVRPWVGGRVLDVGCGTGLVLERLPAGTQGVGIDHDPDCVARAAERLAGRRGIAITRLSVLDPAVLELGGSKFDTVLFVSSLEEVRDPALAFVHAAKVLRPGGWVAVFVSSLPALTGTLDRSLGMHRYAPAELRGHLVAAGFTVEVFRYVNLLGALGWWWDSKVVRRTAVPEVNYRRRDRLVPFARALDRLTGPPLGRSLLAVGRLPG